MNEFVEPGKYHASDNGCLGAMPSLIAGLAALFWLFSLHSPNLVNRGLNGNTNAQQQSYRNANPDRNIEQGSYPAVREWMK